MTPNALVQVRTLVRQLPLREKLYLLYDLTLQLIQQSAARSIPAERPPLPIFHLDTWPSDLPLRRAELYEVAQWARNWSII